MKLIDRLILIRPISEISNALAGLQSAQMLANRQVARWTNLHEKLLLLPPIRYSGRLEHSDHLFLQRGNAMQLLHSHWRWFLNDPHVLAIPGEHSPPPALEINSPFFSSHKPERLIYLTRTSRLGVAPFDSSSTREQINSSGLKPQKAIASRSTTYELAGGLHKGWNLIAWFESNSERSAWLSLYHVHLHDRWSACARSPVRLCKLDFQV